MAYKTPDGWDESIFDDDWFYAENGIEIVFEKDRIPTVIKSAQNKIILPLLASELDVDDEGNNCLKLEIGSQVYSHLRCGAIIEKENEDTTVSLIILDGREYINDIGFVNLYPQDLGYNEEGNLTIENAVFVGLVIESCEHNIYLPVKDYSLEQENYVSPFTTLKSNDYTFKSYENIHSIAIPEFSGIAFGCDRTKLYGVSNHRERVASYENESYGGLYTIDLEKLETEPNDAIEHIWKLPMKVTNSQNTKSYEDSESVTVRVNGFNKDNVYIGFERLQQLVLVKGDNYDVIETFDFSGGTTVRGHNYTATVGEDGYDANDGIEGVEYFKEDMFFVSNQIKPAEISLYDVRSASIVNTQVMEDPVKEYEYWCANIVEDLPYEIADLCYVKSINELWVMNSDRGVIYRYSVEAHADKERDFLHYVGNIKLLFDGTTSIAPVEESMKIRYNHDKGQLTNISKNNPEALAVDERNGIVYVGAEGYSEAEGKLYVFDIKESGLTSDFQSYIEMAKILKQKAETVLNSYGLPKDDADLMVAKFGRSKVYNSKEWDNIGGSLSDNAYFRYESRAEDAASTFRYIKYINLPNGRLIDAPHFWATICGSLNNHGDFCGWAGDLYQFAKNLQDDDEIDFPSGGFNEEDWNADTDAYLLYHRYGKDIINNLEEYYETASPRDRAAIFEGENKVTEMLTAAQNSSDALLYTALATNLGISSYDITRACRKMQEFVNGILN